MTELRPPTVKLPANARMNDEGTSLFTPLNRISAGKSKDF